MNWLINAAAALLTLAFVTAYAVAAMLGLWAEHGGRGATSDRAAGVRRITDKQFRRIFGGERGRRPHPLFQMTRNGRK